MATTVEMPQLGETVTEGTILRWAKAVGDSIAEDEVLLEISTDKVDTEVPSPVGGTVLEILVEEGDTVEVGTAMVVIGGEGEDSEPTPEVEETPSELPEPEPPVSEVDSEPADAPNVTEAAPKAATVAPASTADAPMRQVLSPVVRKLAREHGVDLGQISGSGDGGRITRQDVEAFVATGPAPVTPEPAAVLPAPTPASVPAPIPAPTVGGGDEVVELDRLRVRVAENMTRSKQTAAHVWTSVEVDYERLERVRQAHRDEWKAQEGFSLTYLPFIVRATIDALKEYPTVNSSFHFEEKQRVLHRSVHMGIAVDVDQKGLLVVTIREADGLRLVGIARRIRELATKARDSKLTPDDVASSSFTITNPGPFGSYMSAPIINVPNSGILSTDTVVKRPSVITAADGQDMIAIRHIGYLGLSWDHRSFDGSTAVLFLRRVKENLETWDWEQELA